MSLWSSPFRAVTPCDSPNRKAYLRTTSFLPALVLCASSARIGSVLCFHRFYSPKSLSWQGCHLRKWGKGKKPFAPSGFLAVSWESNRSLPNSVIFDKGEVFQTCRMWGKLELWLIFNIKKTQGKALRFVVWVDTGPSVGHPVLALISHICSVSCFCWSRVESKSQISWHLSIFCTPRCPHMWPQHDYKFRKFNIDLIPWSNISQCNAFQFYHLSP